MWQPECAGRAPQSQRMCSSEIWLWNGCTLTAGDRWSPSLQVSATHSRHHTGVTAGRRRATAHLEAKRRKERTFPEPWQRHSRTRLVVLTAEIGGKWPEEAADFLTQLARAKARCAPRVLQIRARQAWQQQRSSFRGRWRPAARVDGDAPSSSDVVSDTRKPLIRFL